MDPGKILGVRTPALRALAKETAGTAEALDFMAALPHRYYDEDNLHALYINAIRDYPRALRELARFLPYVDNWATCDMLSPRSFKRRPEGLADEARRWISSGETYTARFGIGVLMKFYLDEGFEPEMPGWAAAACRGDYYVDMGAAWYFATGHSQAARGRHRHAHRAPPERLGAQQDHTKGAGVLPRQRGDEGPI